MEEDIITSNQTPEELAAEEAAFASSFNEARGIEQEEPVAKGPVVEQEEPVAKGPVVEQEEPVAKPSAKKPLTIAGLTEEQIAQALSRIGTMQSAIDKMAGRNGQLMQQIEQLRNNPPQAQAQQKALDIKLARLSESFPELAKLLQEDLQAATAATAVAPVEPAQPSAPVFTAEMFEAKLAERLTPLQEQIEVKVLSVLHPDWAQIVATPEFALYRDNVLPDGEGRKLMESEDAAYIATKLTDFKKWREAQSAPAPTPLPTPAPTPSTVSRRLAGAVLPSGSAPVTPAAQLTEEDGFLAGFNNERKRAGY